MLIGWRRRRLEDNLMDGKAWLEPVWQALDRSLLIGFVIVLAVWSLQTYEFWFLEQGHGYLSSGAEAVPDADKAHVFAQSLLLMPVQLAAISGVFFLVQAPMIVFQMLLDR
jgi:hypothetical protein